MVLPAAPFNDPIPDELSRLNRALQMLSRCNRALVRATEETELLHEVCQLIVEVGGYVTAWIGYACDDAERSVTPVAQKGVEVEFLETLKLRWADAPGGRGPTGRAIREQAVQIIHDVSTDPITAPYLAIMRERNTSSVIALPLIIEGRCIGVLDIHSSRVNAFDAPETALLRELADDLAYGIRVLRMHLENRESQRSLWLFRTLLDRANDAIYVLDGATGRLLDVNDALSRWLGYTRAQLLEMSVRQFSLAASPMKE